MAKISTNVLSCKYCGKKPHLHKNYRFEGFEHDTWQFEHENPDDCPRGQEIDDALLPCDTLRQAKADWVRIATR